jgi:hypothetical protein
MTKLRENHTEEEITEAIIYLDQYMEEKKYKTANHKITLERWVFDAIKKKNSDPGRASPKKKRKGFDGERTTDYSALEEELLGKKVT